MNRNDFIQGVVTNAARVREYKPGMDGRDGQCDCIGLIIGAIRLMGGVWTGTHGSNYAARMEMSTLQKIPSASVLQAGDLVYKAHTPGESGYNLPAAYCHHPDQTDYYHVGVVENVNPLVILHCTNVPGGIKRDSTLGNWAYFGCWQGIADDTEAWETYCVTGGQLKMRSGPGKNYPVTAYLPDGTRVQAAALPEIPDWLQVVYQGQKGFCMACYLEKIRSSSNDAVLEKAKALLEEALMLIQKL